MIQFRRNSGQTAAMMAGIDHASGEIIVTIDADLQNDPAGHPDAARAKLDEGYDVVSGWRKDRTGRRASAAICSAAIANRVISAHLGRAAARLRLHAEGLPRARC